jgi:diaminopimelate decarboxylase
MTCQYDTPFYLFDEQGFIDNYRHLCNAMQAYYPNYIPGYSYKTNYTPYVCQLIKDLGGYAEVVSDMELTLARKIGYDATKIIYNGPCKGKEMESHLLQGGISNIDNENEALRVIKLANNNPNKRIKVGIRVNTDIGANFISRFGLEVGSKELQAVIDSLKAVNNISIVGLHMHVSRARYLSAWQNRINNILAVADEYIDGIPEYIDLGSGMFADMEDCLKEQFTIEVPTYEQYAEVIAGTMANHYAKSDKKPILFTEPGTTVVSRYFSLVTTIKAIKCISNKSLAIVDIDIHNAGETCQMMKLPYTLLKKGNGICTESPCNIVGYTCLEQDVLYENFPESLQTGDVLEFRNVGGYSIVYKPPFIQPNCPIYAIDRANNLTVIKRAETFEDIFQTFKF